MTVTTSTLVAPQQLIASNVTYYTAAALTILDKMTLCNTTAVAATATFDLVPLSGTAGVTKRIMSAQSVAPGATYLCPEIAGHSIEIGYTLQGFSSTASALTVMVSGRKIT